MEQDARNTQNKVDQLLQEGFKMDKQTAEVVEQNPRVDEDRQRALKGLFSELQVLVGQLGYTIDEEHDGTSHIVYRQGPYPNSIVAMTEILKGVIK
jgi:hypothetical protein